MENQLLNLFINNLISGIMTVINDTATLTAICDDIERLVGLERCDWDWDNEEATVAIDGEYNGLNVSISALNGLFLIDDTKDPDTDEYYQQTHKTKATKDVAPRVAQAVADVEKAGDRSELVEVWKRYPDLHKDPDFNEAVTAKNAQIQAS